MLEMHARRFIVYFINKYIVEMAEGSFLQVSRFQTFLGELPP